MYSVSVCITMIITLAFSTDTRVYPKSGVIVWGDTVFSHPLKKNPDMQLLHHKTSRDFFAAMKWAEGEVYIHEIHGHALRMLNASAGEHHFTLGNHLDFTPDSPKFLEFVREDV